MVSNFDLVKLKKMITDLYNVTGLRITVFDEKYIEIMAYPEPLPEFCSLVRTRPEGSRRCYESDKLGCELATDQYKAHIYKCHAGLTEVITAMKIGNLIVGYLCFGHISPTKNTDEAWQLVKKKIQDLDLPLQIMEDAFKPREYLDDVYLESAANLLLAVSSYVCVTHMAELVKDDLPVKIDKYIYDNLSADLGSEILCDNFEISRAKLYQISMSNFGMGITEYIRTLRIKKAQEYLLNTNLSVKQIAANVGIPDFNYFSKVFKREVGVVPSEYREKVETIPNVRP